MDGYGAALAPGVWSETRGLVAHCRDGVASWRRYLFSFWRPFFVIAVGPEGTNSLRATLFLLDLGWWSGFYSEQIILLSPQEIFVSLAQNLNPWGCSIVDSIFFVTLGRRVEVYNNPCPAASTAGRALRPLSRLSCKFKLTEVVLYWQLFTLYRHL